MLNQRIEKSIEPVQYFEQAVLMQKQLLMAKFSDIFSLYLVVCFCFNRTPYYNVDRDKMDLNRLYAVAKFLFPPVVFISLKVHGFMILLFFENIRFVELTRLVLYVFMYKNDWLLLVGTIVSSY